MKKKKRRQAKESNQPAKQTAFGETLRQALKEPFNPPKNQGQLTRRQQQIKALMQPEPFKMPPKAASQAQKTTPTNLSEISKDISQTNKTDRSPSTTYRLASGSSQNQTEFKEIIERRLNAILALKNPELIQLGIDLGTSCSKVVWRNIKRGGAALPLCFGENASNLESYFAPSIVCFDGESFIAGKTAALAAETKTSLAIPNFKICLTCENTASKTCSVKNCSLSNWRENIFSAEIKSREAEFVTAFYLAKLLAKSRQLIVKELEKQGFSQPIPVKWSATLAVPDKFIENSRIAAAFETALQTAWLMAEVFAVEPKLKERDKIFALYAAARGLVEKLKSERHAFDCFVYSEVGAEVASVLLSRTSEEGLYAFVDVGAGTVDASVFRFYRDDGEAQRAPYAAEVFHVGAAHIEARANRKLIENSAGWLKTVKEKYRSLTDSEHGSLLRPIVALLKKAATEVKEETEQNLLQIFRAAYDKERDVSKWQNLKLVIGGGGGKIKAYENAAAAAFTLKNPLKTPEKIELAVPPDFQLRGLPASEFHRFAVAYGLSHNIVDLPPFIAPREIAPLGAKSQFEGIDWYAK